MPPVNRYMIGDAIEEWRDECFDAGIDYADYAVLYNDDMIKDLARHIMTRIRQKTEDL